MLYSFHILLISLIDWFLQTLPSPKIFSKKRLRNAYEKLKKTGIPLASNQVNYSLIYRKPEENGVKTAYDELGITLIAYCPIAQAHPPALVEDYPPSDEDLTHTHTQSQELKSFATTSSCA
ncbi:hypothetical protein KPL71_023553 [Citrus sinensis]|uniref:Uncharacterized protein n=1 Tax=Citrus sinensis TaxID=2711 RepID=A0ACB8ILQ3_CITSI|nr:hypothetical protein KPL71_023553 [Citrus sinensis]